MGEVCVVGAGVAGLVAAGELERAGLDVTVLEAAEVVGGRVRTDHVDGFRCDRGFQLLNPAYPAVRAHVDVRALGLRRFAAGAALATGQGLRVVADPRRSPRLLPATLRSGYVDPAAVVRLARWVAPALLRPQHLDPAGDAPLVEALDGAGVRGPLRDDVLVPFLSGVLADDRGRDSAHFVRLLLATFLKATPGVPTLGMTALPHQLAARLRRPPRLGVRVTSLRPAARGVVLSTSVGELRARAAVVAADPASTAGLTGLPAPTMKGLATWWFAADEPPRPRDLLVLDPQRRGPVVNAALMSVVAPSYAPPGRHLVQATSLLGRGRDPDDASVRAHVGTMYGVDAGRWETVAVHRVPGALPQQRPRGGLTSPVTLGDGVYVAGDHRDTGSLQGAMVSGRRAARAVLTDLGVGPGLEAADDDHAEGLGDAGLSR